MPNYVFVGHVLASNELWGSLHTIIPSAEVGRVYLCPVGGSIDFEL